MDGYQFGQNMLHENEKFYFKVNLPNWSSSHHPTNIFCFCGITYISFVELIIAYPNGCTGPHSAKFAPLAQTQGWIKVVWGPWLKLRKGPFQYIFTVFNREKVNKRTEVFVLLKQRAWEKTNPQLIWCHAMYETHWFQVSISYWRLETISISVHRTPMECFEYTVAPIRRPPHYHDRFNAVFPTLMHYLLFH